MTVVALDLDRTLIYSTAALALPHGARPHLLVAELHEGAPISYLTLRAVELLATLAEAAIVVPCTTRTRTQYARVRVPGFAARYAITSNGGHLLVDGVPDPAWSDVVAVELAGAAPVAEVAAHLARVAAGGWVRSRRVADDLFCYLVVNRAELPAGFVAELAGWCTERGWATSVQGRKIYCVPTGLTKRAAALEVARRVGEDRYLAAGDSLLDAELLVGAAAGVRPAAGELADLGWRPDHVEVTDAAGVLGGEEVLARLLRLAKL